MDGGAIQFKSYEDGVQSEPDDGGSCSGRHPAMITPPVLKWYDETMILEAAMGFSAGMLLPHP